MARESKKVISTVSREQAEDAMATVATSNSRLKKLEAQIELEKQKVDEKYTEQIQALTDAKKVPMEMLEVYAKQECRNWDSKSFDLIAGTIGFRTNPPKLDKKKGFTWDAVTDLLKKYFPHLVRSKEEPNKELIISMREEKEFEKVKEKCFLSVVQDETFFVKTKEEELATA
ncbi:MAG: host-nuclease inhibitor Gam family protein [Flavisolibacter sp.]|jgi:phage host-nuclease inhibitor protein Gam